MLFYLNYYVNLTALENMPDFFFRWCMTTNHKDISLLYAALSFFCGFISLFIIIIIHINFFLPSNILLNISYKLYTFLIIGHIILMLFFTLMPFLLGCIGTFFLPIVCGASEFAFPRLTSLSFWLLTSAFLLFSFSFFVETILCSSSSDFTLYSNLSTNLVILCLILVTLSFFFLSINFITTILNMRAPGLYFNRLPIFGWVLFLITFLLLIFLPLFVSILILLLFDQKIYTFFVVSSVIFNFFFNHFVTYFLFILIIIISLIIKYFDNFFFSHLYLGGLFYVGISIIILSLLIWFYNITSINDFKFDYYPYFISAIFVLAVPLVIFLLKQIFFLYLGSLSTPLLFSLVFLFYSFVGIFIFLKYLSLPRVLNISFLLVNFYYFFTILIVLSLFAGFYFWFTKITGSSYSQFLSQIHFWLFFIGSNFIFLSLYISNFKELFWSISYYFNIYIFYNIFSYLGAYFLFISFIVFLALVFNAISTKNYELYQPEHPSISRVPYFSSLNFHGTSNEFLVEQFPFDEEAIFFSAVILHFFTDLNKVFSTFSLKLIFKNLYYLPALNLNYKFFYLYNKPQIDILYLLDSEVGLVKEMRSTAKWSYYHAEWIAAYRMPERREWRWFVDIPALSLLDQNQFWSKYFWYK